jgi:hypothetical protein
MVRGRHPCGGRIHSGFDRIFMQPLIYSDDVIEAMVDAMCSARVTERDRDIYREALRGLVRLGQAEQLLSMQLDFNAMTSFPVTQN